MDTEQNERLQEEEHEIVRLWEARNTVLSRLELTSLPIDENHSFSEIHSPDHDSESISSRHTDIPKVKSSKVDSDCRMNSLLSAYTERYGEKSAFYLLSTLAE